MSFKVILYALFLINIELALFVVEEGMMIEDTPQDLSVGKECVVPRSESPNVDACLLYTSRCV